jgi:DNA-binding transcriptional LysR family regulator
MRAQLRSDRGRWAAIILLTVAALGAAIAALPAWTIPISIAGWALIVVLVVSTRHPARSVSAALRDGLAEFSQPVSRRHATVSLLAVGVPVLVLLALAILSRYV